MRNNVLAVPYTVCVSATGIFYYLIGIIFSIMRALLLFHQRATNNEPKWYERCHKDIFSTGERKEEKSKESDTHINDRETSTTENKVEKKYYSSWG